MAILSKSAQPLVNIILVMRLIIAQFIPCKIPLKLRPQFTETRFSAYTGFVAPYQIGNANRAMFRKCRSNRSQLSPLINCRNSCMGRRYDSNPNAENESSSRHICFPPWCKKLHDCLGLEVIIRNDIHQRQVWAVCPHQRKVKYQSICPYIPNLSLIIRSLLALNSLNLETQ